MKTAFLFPALFAWSLLPAARITAADGLSYFPASLDNTTLADGTALKAVTKAPAAPGEVTRGTADAEPNNHWHWREGAGSGAGDQRGVLAAAGARDNDAPMLRTLVSGLQPQSDYQVFGFYWVAGYATDEADPAGDTQWDIRLGCGKAKMMGYGHRDNAGLPGTIGRRDNGDGAVRQMDAPLRPATGTLLDRDGDRRLFRAPLGCERTDAKGTLVVYVDDQTGDANEGRTWYDGIGVMPATTKADVGSAAPGALHLAVRCGDWEMVRRELAAGADLNTVDHDGLTPLFYLAAALDAERVAAFLQAGAKPEVENQTLSPLCAAATSGDVEITKMLLDAGAKIANRVAPSKSKDLRLYNPVEAAIRSGSVAVLKLLLAQAPDLDLERTVYGPDFDSKDSFIFNRHHQGLVRSSLQTNCPEMAAFLIDRGCTIDFAEDQNLPTGREGRGITWGSHTLMVMAVMNHPPMLEEIAALVKRGEPLILDQEVPYDVVVVPWDALSGAVWEGQTALVSQWLPQAAKVNEEYQLRLTVLAESCGSSEVLEMVRRQFPKVKWAPYPHPYDPVEMTRTRISGPKGLFTPRTLAPETRKTANGTKVLAVISSPEASGPAAALAAKASQQSSWTVVEREEIEKLLGEKPLATPTSIGSAELSAIGDRLSADVFIMVSRFGQGDKALLSFEAANVITGLPFDRLIIALKEFNPDTFSADYLARVRRKLDSQSGGGAPTGITLLDISADPKVPQGRTLANILHAGLLQEIDAIPGLIALTREQLEPLATEKTLKQSGVLWGAAWTLEGGLSQSGGDQVELAVRLRSLGSNPISHDVKVTGSPDHPQVMVQEAWRKIAALLDKSMAADKDTAPEQLAATEAARLMREAEWFANCKRSWEAVQLIDAALYLGADPLKAHRLRMRIRWESRHFGNPREMFGSVYDHGSARGYPLRPEFHDYARRWVSEHLELLRMTSETLDRVQQILKEHPDEISNNPYEDFWIYWGSLATYRSQLVPAHMNTEQLATLKEFDAELETYFKRLLPLLEKNVDELEKLFGQCEHYTEHFRAIPWLGGLFADEIIRTWPSTQADYRPWLFEHLNQTLWFDYGRADIICALLEKAMVGKDIPFRELRQAEIACLRSSGPQRIVAARHLWQTRIATASRLRPPYTNWVVPSPMLTKDFNGNSTTLTPHGEWVIPSLVHSPEPVPDMFVRHQIYDEFTRSWLKAGQDDHAKDAVRQGLAANLDRRINEAPVKGLGAAAWDDILSSVRLLDKTLGFALAGEMEPRIAKLRSRIRTGSFGSKGQFPILNLDGTVDTKLLADVRVDPAFPAMITHTMVDPKNRHLLWLILQPYQDWDFKLQEPRLNRDHETLEECLLWGSATPPFTARQPWLVAIDCRDGHTVHKINLGDLPGLWSNGPPETMAIDRFDRLFRIGMLANDTHLMLQIHWAKRMNPDDSRVPYETLVSINRETAEIQVFPRKMIVMGDSMGGPGWLTQYAVAGMGDSFFIVERFKNQPKDSSEPIHHRLWQYKPGAEPQRLTQPGRRPEESPFDANDQMIKLIRADDQRLLVASSWDHFAYYNPAQARWDDAPVRGAQEWKNHIYGIDTMTYRANLTPYNSFGDPDGGQDTYQFWHENRYEKYTKNPGRMKFQIGDGPVADLPVSLMVPESYRARFQVNSDPLDDPNGPTHGPYEWISVADMARSSWEEPVIFNQTDEHFVLGMRLSSRSIHVTDLPPYLPFLWILDKKEAVAAMKRTQAK